MLIRFPIERRNLAPRPNPEQTRSDYIAALCATLRVKLCQARRNGDFRAVGRITRQLNSLEGN